MKNFSSARKALQPYSQLNRFDALIDQDQLESLFIRTKQECDDFENSIVVGKTLGKGNFGTVQEITFKNQPNRGPYAMKKGVIATRKIRTFPFRAAVKYPTVLLSLLNPSLDFTSARPTEVVVPDNMRCGASFTTEAIPQLRGGPTEIVVKAPNYVCQDNSFTEALISSIVAEAYQSGDCAHFFDYYGAFSCLKAKSSTAQGIANVVVEQISVMDKIDGTFTSGATGTTLNKYLGSLGKSEMIDSLYLQIQFAIAFYQTRYKISHNDLHMDNVFVTYVNDKTEYNGKKLIDCDFYHYQIRKSGRNYDLYFRAVPILIRIGDFGLSVRYEEPIIGDSTVFETGYDQHDGAGPWIPNQFIPSYDSMLATTAFITASFGSSMQFVTPYISGALKFLENGAQKPFNYGTRRPNLVEIQQFRTAAQLLTSDHTLIDYEQIPPPGSKVVTLGKLEL